MATKKDWIYQCLPVPCFTLTSHVVCVSINVLNNLEDKIKGYGFYSALDVLAIETIKLTNLDDDHDYRLLREAA